MLKFKEILFFTLLLASCAVAIPFDVNTADSSIDIPNTAGLYVEQVCESPAETQNPKVVISELTLNYTIVNNTISTGTISLYVSLKTAADNQKATATQILSVTVPANQTITGSVTPEILKDAIKQSKYVIGLENVSLTIPGLSKVTLTFNAHAKGTYTL